MFARTGRIALTALALSLPLAARAQTLEIATDQSPVGLDPHVATAFSTALIDSNIYEGLTAIDKDLRVGAGAGERLDDFAGRPRPTISPCARRPSTTAAR